MTKFTNVSLVLLVLVASSLESTFVVASTKTPPTSVITVLTKSKKKSTHKETQPLPHWTDLSFKPDDEEVKLEPTGATSHSDDGKTPLRVCLMVEPSPLTYVSGYANRFQELLRHLERKASKIPETKVELITADVVTPTQPKTAFGFPVRHTFGFRLPFYPIMTMSFDISLQAFRSVCNLKPNLIHASSPGFMALKGIVLSKLLSIPLVLSYHTHIPHYAISYVKPQWLSKLTTRFLWLLIKLAHSMADATVVTSPQIQQEFLEHNVPRVNLWKKGVDANRFHPRHYNQEMRNFMTNNNPNDFCMVFVGRLASEKRAEDLKDVLLRMGPNARLCLVGAGPHEEFLKKHFEGTNTVFTGELHGDELCQTYASADAFAFPSDSETLGFVIMEAMASGIPVVACNRGGIPSMVKHGETGYLLEPDDTDGYVNILTELKNDPNLRKTIAKRARSEVETWTWEESMSNICDVTYRKAQTHYNNRWNVRLWNKLFGGTRRQEQEEIGGAMAAATA